MTDPICLFYIYRCLQCPSSCFQTTSLSCVTNNTKGCWDLSGPGGGGSGGSIYLSAKYVDVGEHSVTFFLVLKVSEKNLREGQWIVMKQHKG